MTSSMTAFGRTEQSLKSAHVIWEIRSVNHRYLEINLRLPDDFRQLESDIRQIISNKIKRGKVDCQLRFETIDSADSDININHDLANKLIDACSEIRKYDPQNISNINPVDILRWPGVIEQENLDSDTMSDEILSLLKTTLDSAIESRLTEGSKLKALILERCHKSSTIVEELKQQASKISLQLKEKLLLRVRELTDEIDNERLEQELAFLAQKYDVDEELDRLSAHIDEVQTVLSKSGPVGRRLDFLMQEMNREANTLGSKATDIQYTNASVELKVLIEQMREQIQNIE